jgi:hypothetical protein
MPYGMSRYLNRQQLVALGGLDPIQIQSGASVHGKSRISKRGNREVRKRLYEATLSAARYNPNIQAIYRRLKDQGKPDKVARAAAARKLLLLAHAVYESGEPFRSHPVRAGVPQELPSCVARAEQPLTDSIQHLTPAPPIDR